IVGALEVFPANRLHHVVERAWCLLEGSLPLAIDQPGCRAREVRRRIARRLVPLRLEEERPASAEAAQHGVEPRAGSDQLGLGRNRQVGRTEAEAALEAAIDRKSTRLNTSH